MKPKVEKKQEQICLKYQVQCVPSPEHLMVGLAEKVRDGLEPIHGLRHPPQGKTTGWYIWAGEDTFSEKEDFFKPVHVSHLKEWCPIVLPYLGLPPGWRFLIDTKGHEDVWEDKTLLDI